MVLKDGLEPATNGDITRQFFPQTPHFLGKISK
jgi:hypothetical protein